MTYTLAVLLLLALFPFVVWPLFQGRIDRVRHRASEGDRRAELIEEVELDAASGRLSPEEARARLAEL